MTPGCALVPALDKVCSKEKVQKGIWRLGKSVQKW